ncbi:MAG: alkaline phosphatase D family protein [Microcoleaceae cyanobacterium]
MKRRKFLISSALLSGGMIGTSLGSKQGLAQSPGIVSSDRMRPKIPYGVASGDIGVGQATIWSRSDRPARMILEYGQEESFRNATRVIGPAALETSDFTARVNLIDLSEGQQIFYRVTFQDLSDLTLYSEPVTGTLRTVPKSGQDIRFAWSGDTAGQGWGINPDWGGMKIYETIRQWNPDFFIHCGDYIYADAPIKSEVQLKDGTIWRNLVTEAKSKVAETLPEFRGNYTYNLLDEHLRRFNAQVPQLVQWDDHETTNNWYPNEQLLTDERYQVKSVALLAARAKQAFLEYTPMRWNGHDPEQIYRSFRFGPMLDVFMLDMRSYRGDNTANRNPVPSPETAFLGDRQINWLKNSLLNSRTTWKVIGIDMPIGLIVRDGETAFENLANGEGVPLGRELEMAELLRFIKRNQIRNIVWLTADVHYAAAHYYHPNQAQFQDFLPFWEFVSGPLHAGSYGPSKLDNTFGPQVQFQSTQVELSNLPPNAGLQFFGTVEIDGSTGLMTVSQHNLAGEVVYSTVLEPDLTSVQT